MSQEKYALLDRDGTLIFEPQDTFQIDSIEQLQVLSGVVEGLQREINRGYKLVMVSNQDGLGTDIYPLENFERVQSHLLWTFREHGITFNEILICSHSPQDNCACRKPKTGLVDKLTRSGNFDREKSYMYGDRDTDGEFANNLGITFNRAKTNGCWVVPQSCRMVI